jgi:GST-like protein
MIDVYYRPTPHGHRVTNFLEETNLEYGVIPIDIGKGEQFAPQFLKMSPNNRMPAIVDTGGAGGVPIFESAAPGEEI